MHRRPLLLTIAAAVAGALTACAPPALTTTSSAPTTTPPGTPPVPRPTPTVSAPPAPVRPFAAPSGLVRTALPGGTLTALPGEGSLLALTVDDGADSEVVAAYIRFAEATGMRLTFFLNGSYDAWTANAPALRPLVDSGQIQLGNHTWSHPDLTGLSDREVVGELQRNEDFIHSTYGLSAAPFFRPPFGFHNARVDSLAAGIGYTAPTLWYGSLSDSGLITREQLMSFADQWLLPQHIVIGHANFTTVTQCFDHITETITARGLQPVTLRDVFTA